MNGRPGGSARRRGQVAAGLLLLLVAACGGDSADVSTTAPEAAAPATTQPADDATTTAAPGTEAPPASTETPDGSTTSTTEHPQPTAPTSTVVSDADATQEDPVPLGEAQELGSWMLVVTDVELDATDTITSFVDFNPEPAPGNQFVIVTLAGTYLGSEFGEPGFQWKLVNEDLEAVPEGISCGVVPASIYELSPVGPGESFAANICLEAPAEAVGEGLLINLAPLGTEGKYFALTPAD